MNLHQFRFVQEAVRRNLNSDRGRQAAAHLTAGVSKAIIELEEELGVGYLRAPRQAPAPRDGAPGQQVLKSIEIIPAR